MYSNQTTIRVRYGETDKMGYVYYGNYALYYETARVESLRNLEISYKKMEESGILMPVLSLQINYIKPVFYDELLTIITRIPEMPTSRISFHHEIYNESSILVNKGSVTLAFINARSGKPTRCPENVIIALQKFY